MERSEEKEESDCDALLDRIQLLAAMEAEKVNFMKISNFKGLERG